MKKSILFFLCSIIVAMQANAQQIKERELSRTEEFSNLSGTLLKKEFIDIGEFNKIPQKEHQLYCGIDIFGNPKLVDCNNFPHMLIGGDTGSGKSRFLMMLLSNLIGNCNDINLYLLQIRKSDLIVFKNCKQTKFIARNLKDTRDLLKHLDNICQKRDKEIERLTLSKGIYNIEDYNRYMKSNKMKYSYIVLDEFSFFNPNGADKKDIKDLKREILAYIKNIVLVGRSVGVFIITSLQKPTSSSIPSDIKSQLTCRVSFRMNDVETSVIVLGNGGAVNLNKRCCILRTLGESTCQTQFIDHKIIMNNIKDTIEKDKKYIELVPKEEIKEVTKVNNEGIVNLEVLKNVINNKV